VGRAPALPRRSTERALAPSQSVSGATSGECYTMEDEDTDAPSPSVSAGGPTRNRQARSPARFGFADVGVGGRRPCPRCGDGAGAGWAAVSQKACHPERSAQSRAAESAYEARNDRVVTCNTRRPAFQIVTVHSARMTVPAPPGFDP
jgi:hypothetical protein